MGVLSWLKDLLKPLPGQTVMDRKEDIDPNLDPNNTIRDLGSTHANPSVEDTARGLND